MIEGTRVHDAPKAECLLEWFEVHMYETVTKHSHVVNVIFMPSKRFTHTLSCCRVPDADGVVRKT